MMTERTPKTMDGYIRVSRVMGRGGVGYISPKVQREAIARWAEYKGVTIAAWHVDEDESGGRQDRPGLIAATERAIAGETGGIVSWKIDRFSRFTEGGLRDLRQLEAANARLAFVVEDVDTTGPMGKFVFTILLAVGEYVLDNIKAGWNDAKTRAVARGAHIGPTPFGYLKVDDGTLRVDPDRGPVVTEAFVIAARDGLAATVAYLRANAPERTWTTYTTRRFLKNDIYLGIVRNGSRENTVAHDPLTTRATFELVQRNMEAPGRRAPSGDFPLSGLASCGTCGGRMIGGRGGADKRRVYRCADRCDAPAVVSAEPLEDHVVGVLRAAFDHPGFAVGTDSPDVEAAERAVMEAEEELQAFADDLKARKVLGHRYHQHLERRGAAVDEARERMRDALAAEQNTARVIVPAELWDDLEPAELAEVLRAGLSTVVVSKGRGRLDSRVRVVPKGLDSGTVPSA